MRGGRRLGTVAGMSTRSHVTTRTIATLAAFVIVAGCSGGDSVRSTDATTTGPSVPESTAPATSEPASTTTTTATAETTTTVAAGTTTEAPTTTAAATTTVAATTTTEPPLTAADLTLAANGISPFTFGAGDASVIAGLTVALGSPNLDRAQTYPIIDGGGFLDATEEEGYTQPIGRTVCFTNDVCAQFGGATTDTLTFTGWDLTSDAAPRLFTADGISAGSVWSDFPDAITIDDGGCFSIGYGDTAGVELTLLSAGDPFVLFDADGNYVAGMPDPADVSVLAMAAGDLPYFLFDDC